MAGARAVATASEGAAAEAATALLAGGKGNAVDAVVAGVLAAAATDRSVLLGPVQILFGGAGLGLRAVDGRTRQPGKGAPRPRGFTEDQLIAPASRVGVPALPAALAAALASSGQATLAQAMAPAVAAANGERKRVLKLIAQRGPSAMLDESIAGELVASCGRIVGGLLTRDDLDAVMPAITPTTEVALRGPARRAAFVPWSAGAASSRVQIVAAVDYRGLLAVACYERGEDGVTVDALDLLAPGTAAPVLRGQTRVKPGEPCPAAAPLSLVRTAGEGSFDVALGVASDSDGEPSLRAALDQWSDEADAIDVRPPYQGNGSLIGVMRTGDSAILIARR